MLCSKISSLILAPELLVASCRKHSAQVLPMSVLKQIKACLITQPHRRRSPASTLHPADANIASRVLRLSHAVLEAGVLPRQVADLLSQVQQAGQQAVSSLQDAAATLTSSAPAWPSSPQLPQLSDLRLPQLPSSSFPSQWQLPQLPAQWQLPQAPALPPQFQLPSAPSLPSQWSLPSFASPPSVPSIPALDSQLDRVLGSSPAPHFGTQAALDALQAAISWTSYEVRGSVVYGAVGDHARMLPDRSSLALLQLAPPGSLKLRT